MRELRSLLADDTAIVRVREVEAREAEQVFLGSAEDAGQFRGQVHYVAGRGAADQRVQEEHRVRDE